MLVTTTLSVYYLPKLSELQDPADIKNEILQGYKIILPVAAACGLIIYLLRDFIIRLLFTAEFAEMDVLFGWQMVGDTLKVGSWLLGYILAAKALVGWFMISELLFSTLFFTLVYLTVDKWGVEGAAIAHTINYSLHFSFMFALLKFKKII